MFLELEATKCRRDLDSAVGFLDLDIIVYFYTVPPHRGPSWLDHLVAVPASSLRDEVEGVPLAVGPPSVRVRNALHAEGGNAVGSNLPVVGILGVVALG